MSENERDTHFAGFARALMQEVDEKNRAKAQSTGRYLDEEELHLLIAQRAYDLACHIMKNRFPAYPGVHNIVEAVSDLTEWPE